MIRKIDIIAAARSIVRKNEGYQLPLLIHPRRDWWIGLAVFGLVVIGGGLFLGKTYLVYQSVDSLEGAEADQIPRYQAEIVQDVITVYTNRALRYEALVQQSLRTVVPEVIESEQSAEIGSSTEATLVPIDVETILERNETL